MERISKSRFFQSPVGWASVASVTAMVVFNIVAFTWQVEPVAQLVGPATIATVGLA